MNRILFEGALENFAPHSPAGVNVDAEHPPILLIAGAEDHLVTPGYKKANARLIGRSPDITAYKGFSGRPDLIGIVPGWEAVADYALERAL